MSNGFTDATIKGLPIGQPKWTNDFKAQRDDKNTWTGSESFFCRIESIASLIPGKNAPCSHPGFSFLKVNSVEVNNYEGNIYQVTVGYKGRPYEEAEYADHPADDSYTTELAIVTQEEPIESHPKYKLESTSLTPAESVIIRNFKSGKLVPVGEGADAYKFYSIDGAKKGKTFEVTSEHGKEILDFYAKNIESYLTSYQTWRITFTSKDLPTANILNYVGFITTAKGAPAIADNRDWLFMGCNVSQSGEVYTITYEWRLSGIGGWEPKIYNKAEAI